LTKHYLRFNSKLGSEGFLCDYVKTVGEGV
jgi:hypothetical protein